METDAFVRVIDNPQQLRVRHVAGAVRRRARLRPKALGVRSPLARRSFRSGPPLRSRASLVFFFCDMDEGCADVVERRRRERRELDRKHREELDAHDELFDCDDDDDDDDGEEGDETPEFERGDEYDDEYGE